MTIRKRVRYFKVLYNQDTCCQSNSQWIIALNQINSAILNARILVYMIIPRTFRFQANAFRWAPDAFNKLP